MKKLLLSFAFFTTVGIVNSSAQCTPDISCITPSTLDYGMCPDSAAGLPAGIVGVPYSQVISIKTPPTAAHWGQPSANVVSFNVTGVTGLAPGLSYTCSPADCKFLPSPPAAFGCILISGTPTAVWNQKIVVNIDAMVTMYGVPLPAQPKTNEQYWSVVTGSTGINSLDLTKFDVEQNAPNPFNGKSEIRFSSVSNTDIEFKVYNLLGSIVYDNKFKAEKGVNTIKIEANSFAPGVYVYSVKNGEIIITKRMIVSSN